MVLEILYQKFEIAENQFFDKNERSQVTCDFFSRFYMVKL